MPKRWGDAPIETDGKYGYRLRKFAIEAVENIGIPGAFPGAI